MGLDGLQLIEGFILQFAFRGVAFDGENFLNESIALGLLFFVDDLLQRRVAGILLDLIAGHAGRFGGGFQRGALLLESREQRLEVIEGHIGEGGAIGAGSIGIEHLDGFDGLIDFGLVLGFIDGLLQIGKVHLIHFRLGQAGLEALGLQRLAGGFGLGNGGGKVIPVIVLADLIGGEVLLSLLLVGGQGILQRIAGDIEILNIGDGKIGLPILLLGKQFVAALQLAPLAGKQLGIIEERNLFAIDGDFLLQDIQTFLAEGELFAGGVAVGFILSQQHGEQLFAVLDAFLDLLGGKAFGQFFRRHAAFGLGRTFLRLFIEFGGGHIGGCGNFLFGEPQFDVSLLFLFQFFGGLLILLLLDVLIPLLGHQRVGVQGSGIDIDGFAFAIAQCAGEDNQTGDELIGIGIAEAVIAGGKGEQTVTGFDIYGCFDNGTLHDLFDVLVLGGVIIAIDEIVIIEIGVIGFAHDHGKDFVHILAVDAIVADERVLLVVAELFVSLQVAEHGTIAHIVAVNDGIVGGLGLIDAEINIGDAPVIVLAVDIGTMIFIVIFCLHYGIIQLGIRNFDPAGNIGIALVERFEPMNVFFGVAIDRNIGGAIGIVQAGQFIGKIFILDGLHLIIDDIDGGGQENENAKPQGDNADLIVFGQRLHLDALNEIGALDVFGRDFCYGRAFGTGFLFHRRFRFLSGSIGSFGIGAAGKQRTDAGAFFQFGVFDAAGELFGVLGGVEPQDIEGLPDGDLRGIGPANFRDGEFAVPDAVFIGQGDVQLPAADLTVNAKAQRGVPGAATLLRQQPGDEGSVFIGDLQEPFGDFQLLPDVGVIVGGAVTAIGAQNRGELLLQQTIGAPFRSGDGKTVTGKAIHDNLGQRTIADAIEVDSEGLLHMADGPLQVIIGFRLGGAGSLYVDFVIPALVAGSQFEMGALIETGDFLRDRELIQLQHPDGAVTGRKTGQFTQQRANFRGIERGEFAGEGGQRH